MIKRTLGAIVVMAVVLGALVPILQTNAGGGKETICHYPPGNPANAHTIEVGKGAVKAHLKHGDTIGPCLTATVEPTATAMPPTATLVPTEPPSTVVVEPTATIPTQPPPPPTEAPSTVVVEPTQPVVTQPPLPPTEVPSG